MAAPVPAPVIPTASSIVPAVPAPPAMKQEQTENLAQLQARLQAANEERVMVQTEVTTLQQEEEVSISGSNARLMVMQKLSRKTAVCKACIDS